MAKNLRKSGIEILGEVPWGTHFCQFYHTGEELIDILVPYLKKGLENNEFCVWITSSPLMQRKAEESLRKAIPDFDSYRASGQMEILCSDLHSRVGVFDCRGVLNGWVKKLDTAIAGGYDGLRLSWNVLRVEKKGWRDLAAHEEEINSAIGGYRMISLCAYSLEGCTADEVIDVVNTHQFALAKREGQWELIESSERRRAVEELRRAHDEMEKRVEERTAELARTVEALRDKDRMLLQQSRQAAMGEIIGNIAHQWRQPLNGLGLIIQSLSIVQESGELSREYLQSVEERAMGLISHMSQTIDDFREYFKPDKEKVLFSVSQAVSKAVSFIADSFRNRQITIEVLAGEDPLIDGYPNEYSQVLLNILLNARDAFSERKVGDAKVTITMCAENGKAVVTITDNAGGIPGEIIDRIFDPYFTTKGPDQGTGVGLFMSKGIIEKNMGGRLTARNTGNGTEFRIEV